MILLPKLDFLFPHTSPAKAFSSFKFQLKSFLLIGALPDTPFSPETKKAPVIYYAHQTFYTLSLWISLHGIVIAYLYIHLPFQAKNS